MFRKFFRVTGFHFFIIFVFLVAIFFYGQAKSPVSIDAQIYREMAFSFFQLPSQIPSPFTYRILGPFLAGLFSKDVDSSFYMLTFLTLILILILFYHYLIKRGISESVAVFILFMLVCNKYLFGFFVWNFYHLNDVLAMLFILLLFYSIEHNRPTFYSIFLSIGILAREVVLLIIPISIFYHLRNKEKKGNFLKYLFGSLLAFIIFIVVRYLLTPRGSDQWPFFIPFEYVRKIFSVSVLYRLLINSFAPLSLIPLLYPNATRKYLGDNFHQLIFFILIFLSAFLGKDNERLIAPAFIFFYSLIAFILQKEIIGDKRGGSGYLILIAFLGFLSSLHHRFARYPLPSKTITIFLSFSSLIITTAIFYIIKKLKSQTRRNTVVIS